MTLNETLAEYFKSRPNTWIDGRELSHVAGCYGWRSRCADIRREFRMEIQNQQQRLKNADGKPYCVSRYRYVPTEEPAVLSVGHDGQSSFL